MGTKLVNCVAVFVVEDVKKTAGYYKTVLGFTAEEHFDHHEPFAALYRDDVEIVIVQARFGHVQSNNARYGAGYDVYLDPEDVEGVDALYRELKAKGATIHEPPSLKPYGSYEFSVEDCDGRLIGFGQIQNKELFFRNNR